MRHGEIPRHLGQLMPLEDLRFPIVVMRRTCVSRDQYLGRLPDEDGELAEYRKNCGMDAGDIYVLGTSRGNSPGEQDSYAQQPATDGGEGEQEIDMRSSNLIHREMTRYI